MWVSTIVETHRPTGDFRTVHIQPELSIESLSNYNERGDLHILIDTVESRLAEVKFIGKELEKEQAELERLKDALSGVARKVLGQLSKERKADSENKNQG